MSARAVIDREASVPRASVCRERAQSREVSLLTKQRLVVAVVLAEELVDPVVLGQERERARDEPGPGEDVRVLDHRFVLERAEVRPAEPLDDVQCLGRLDSR